MSLYSASRAFLAQHGPAGPGGANGDAPPKCRQTPIHANRHMRVICVGAGASGIYLAYKLKHYFTDFTLNVYEKNRDIGGTWFENRYPGCKCFQSSGSIGFLLMALN